jgi:hypothetical protein
VLDVGTGRKGPAVAVQDGDPRLRRGGEPGEVLIEEAEGVRSSALSLAGRFTVMNAAPPDSRYRTSS